MCVGGGTSIGAAEGGEASDATWQAVSRVAAQGCHGGMSAAHQPAGLLTAVTRGSACTRRRGGSGTAGGVLRGALRTATAIQAEHASSIAKE